MRVLVTGGAGYIGSHTVLELVKAGYDVTVLDNLSNSSKNSLERVVEILKKEKNDPFLRLPLLLVDLRNKDVVDNVFMNNRFDAVIHFAGLKAVGESVKEPLDYYDNNVVGTINLLNAMKKYNTKNFVFSSSATVYAQENQSPLNEEMPLSTINPYGESKLMVENILDDLSKSDSDWNIVKLRYFNPIGAHSSGQIGEDPKDTPNNLLPYVTQVAVKKLEKLSVFGGDYPTHDGTGIRDYIHVVDLAKGHVAALRKVTELPGSNAFNLGTGNGYSVLDIVNTFEQKSGVKVPYEIIERREGDLAEVFSDPSKANSVLDWRAEKSLESMLVDAWNWQKQNPEGYN